MNHLLAGSIILSLALIALYWRLCRFLEDRRLIRALQAQTARHRAEVEAAIRMMGMLMCEYSLAHPLEMPLSPEWFNGLVKYAEQKIARPTARPN